MKVANFLEHKEDVLRTKQCVNNVQKGYLNMSKHDLTVSTTRFNCVNNTIKMCQQCVNSIGVNVI